MAREQLSTAGTKVEKSASEEALLDVRPTAYSLPAIGAVGRTNETESIMLRRPKATVFRFLSTETGHTRR